MMFAVIKSGGKQYKVIKDDQLAVEKLSGVPGSVVHFDEVLMICEDGKAPTIGVPLIEKAKVFAEVIEQSKSKKILIFKKKRRQNYRKTKGHRQERTLLKILEISPSGIQTSKSPKKTTSAKKVSPIKENSVKNKKVVNEKAVASPMVEKKKVVVAEEKKSSVGKKKKSSTKTLEKKKSKDN